MLKRFGIPSTSLGRMTCLGICAMVVLVGIGIVLAQAAEDGDPPPPTEVRPERAAEEVDIFKERAREMARQERREQKQNKKKKKKSSSSSSMSNIFSLTPLAPSDVSDGVGAIGRGSHLIGKTFGRDLSITPLEVMPYMLADEHFFFSDVRGFITNDSRAGGNAGLGYRYLREDYNAWGGASIWYDGDQSSSKYFQQVGLSFEGLIQRFEARSNVYIPFTSAQTISNSVSNAMISGNQLLYGRSIDQGTALHGADLETGFSVPVRERHVVRAYVGGYFFENGVNGFKARVEGVYNNGPTAQLLFTSDKLYGECLMVGLSMQLPFGNKHPTAGWKRPTPSPFRFVERNYNVIVDQQRTNLGNQVAIDPATGNPYNVQQVYSPSSGSAPAFQNGTTTNPYSSVAAAQAAGGNVILVQGGSVLSDPVTLAPNQRLLGQGNYSEPIPVQGGGTVQMPNLLQAAGQPGNATQTPIFGNVTGPAVTLASNNEVAGFVVSGTAGAGITGTNVSNASIHDMTFLATSGDSIHLTDSSGDITLNHIQINGSSGNGIVIDGGTPNLTYFGGSNYITSLGNGFVLENLTGGSAAVANLNLKQTGAVGLQISNVATGVTFSGLTATQTTGPAVVISGNTGQVETVNGAPTNVYNTYNFVGNTTISSPKAAGFTVNGTDAIINIQNLNVISTAGSPAVSLVNDPTSPITIGTLTLSSNGGEALSTVGLGTLIVNAGTITSINSPAVDIQSSVVNATFTSISANGGKFGIGLQQSSGIFNVKGTGSYGTGGTIQNTSTGILINTMGTTNIAWMNLTTNGVGIQSTKSTELNVAGLQITGSTGYALDSMDDAALIVSNSIFSTNGAIGAGSIRVQADVLGTFTSSFAGNSITDTSGTPIQFLTAVSGTGASLGTTVQSNTIVATYGTASVIGINWNGPVSANLASNTIDAYGSSMTALSVQDPSTSQSLILSAAGNSITFEPGASQGTGLYVNAGSTSQLSVTQNAIDFKSTDGIGLHFSLAGTSTDYIAGNIITDESGGATGMLFDTVAANSRLQIDANTINLLSTDLTTHQGIIFTQVTPTIQFSGTYNNLIYNASSPQALFSIPVNSATGGFYINGALY